MSHVSAWPEMYRILFCSESNDDINPVKLLL